MTAEHLSSILTSAGIALANHLWQSTVFGAVVGLSAMLLRRHQARLRFSLWLAASIKFLVPFSLLIALGGLLPKPQHVAGGSQMPLYAAIDVAGQPFSGSTAIPIGSAPHAGSLLQHLTAPLPFVLAGIWLFGALVVLLVWVARWRQASAILHRASPTQYGREVHLLRRLEEATGRRGQITLLLSPELMEPEIFGIFRPVLIWPERLSERLEEEQMAAILAHEITHQRRRDNLTAAMHMLVEVVFWFHPMVWWMERRLVEERELACDEAVVRLGSRPEAYAEALLKACRFCVESPLVCASGITGADLSRRVRSIMTLRVVHQLGLKGKLLLVLAAAAAIAIPVTFGIVSAAQTTTGQTAFAQSPSVPEQHAGSGDNASSTIPAFDVISVRQNKSDTQFFRSHFLPDGITVENASLLMLLRQAFMMMNSLDDKFLGVPDWAKSERWNIEARVDPSDIKAFQKLNPQQRGYMLQVLLKDRFGLKVHKEAREQQVYALTIAKSGSRLKEAKADDSYPNGINDGHGDKGAGAIRLTPGHFAGQGIPISVLQMALTQIIGRTVLNTTGLTGRYDIGLDWTSEENRAVSDAPTENKDDSAGPSIFTALQEQLGLKLESQKGPVEVLVIDHVEKPSQN